jgi:hypothetical protein
VARRLADEGHDVRSLRESRGGGRRPDLAVCGTAVEVKSFASAADRPGSPPTDRSVYNKLVDASGQAPHVVLTGYGSGLTEATVRRGLARFTRSGPSAALTSVAALGDGFDLAWTRSPVSERRPVPGRSRPAPAIGL